MNIKEIDVSIEEISQCLGSQVQGVGFFNETLFIDFYQHRVFDTPTSGQKLRLVMYAKAPKAAIFITDQFRAKIKSQTKPIYLFSKAHLIGATFVNIERDLSLGRVVRLDFVNKNEKGQDVEISIVQNLIPVAWNLSIQLGTKTLSLNKPKQTPLMTQAVVADPQNLEDVDISLIKTRTLDAIKGNKDDAAVKTKIPSLSKELAKKTKILEKLKLDLGSKQDLGYQNFAELLGTDPKEAQKLYPHFYDASKNVFLLQKEAFEKHKKNMQKIDRMKERYDELSEEVLRLKQITPEQWAKLHSNKSDVSLQSKHKKNPVDARKFEISPDCIAYAGKSAQNNMLLLRQAKPWHYWMHIKDQPSSHVIIQCQKNRKIEFSDIEKVMKWWMHASSALAKTFQSGDKVPVLVTQCRYVRPIKGDKLGRVNYSHEQVFTIQL